MSIAIDKVFCFPDTLVRYAQRIFDLHESDESPSPQIEMFNSNTTLVAAQMHGVEKLKDIWDGSWNTCTISTTALSRAYAQRIFELCRSNESRASKSDTLRPCYWLVATQSGNRCSGTVGRGTILIYGCAGRVVASTACGECVGDGRGPWLIWWPRRCLEWLIMGIIPQPL